MSTVERVGDALDRRNTQRRLLRQHPLEVGAQGWLKERHSREPSPLPRAGAQLPQQYPARVRQPAGDGPVQVEVGPPGGQFTFHFDEKAQRPGFDPEREYSASSAYGAADACCDEEEQEQRRGFMGWMWGGKSSEDPARKKETEHLRELAGGKPIESRLRKRSKGDLSLEALLIKEFTLPTYEVRDLSRDASNYLQQYDK